MVKKKIKMNMAIHKILMRMMFMAIHKTLRTTRFQLKMSH